MISHRPRKRTWTNQKKGNQIRENLGEENHWTLSSTAHAQRAQQGVVCKGACVTTDGSRGQKSMPLHVLLRDKFTVFFWQLGVRKEERSCWLLPDSLKLYQFLSVAVAAQPTTTWLNNVVFLKKGQKGRSRSPIANLTMVVLIVGGGGCFSTPTRPHTAS